MNAERLLLIGISLTCLVYISLTFGVLAATVAAIALLCWGFAFDD